MLNLSVTMDGCTVPTGTRTDIELFYRFLGMYLNITIPTSETIRQEVKSAEVNQGRVSEIIAARKSRNPFAGLNPEPGKRMIDYLLSVLSKHPEGLAPVQISRLMQKEGWETTSEDPVRMVRVLFHKESHRFVRLPDGRWKLPDSSTHQEGSYSNESEVKPAIEADLLTYR